jgi:[acyl-carrier-protein] S-malonyltransferase
MAKDVVEICPQARELFDHASSILGYNLLEKCIQGPQSDLDRTVSTIRCIFDHLSLIS